MLGRIGGKLYTLLRRSFERKHVHWADNVYASAQELAAKASFCVYRSWGVCERRCIRFCAKACSKSIILRIQKPTHLREALYTLLFKNLQRNRHFTYTLCRLSRGTFTWTTLCRQIAIPNGRLCRQRRHTRISAIRLLISMIKELNVVLIGVADKGRIIHRKADLPQRGVAT